MTTLSKHANDIERLAIVGESNGQEATADFLKRLTANMIQYFDCEKLDEAWIWGKSE